MATTGTLASKSSRGKAAPGAASADRAAAGEPLSEPQEGKIVFFLLLVFTVILLARPQDFIWQMWQVPIAMIVGVPAIALFGISLIKGDLRLLMPTELKLMFALTIWLALGIPFSYWRTGSIQLLSDAWLKALIIFFMLCQTILSLRRVRQLLWVMFLSGFIATGLSLALGGAQLSNAMEEDARFLGLTKGFFSGNYLGIAVSVILPYMAAMMMHTRSFFKQLLLITSFGAMIYLIVFTASRGNMISIVICLILVWSLILRRSIKAHFIGAVFVLGLIGAVALAPSAFWERVGSMWDPDSYAASGVTESARQSQFQRKELLLDSISYTVHHPVFGLGMGNFAIAHGTDTQNAQSWLGTHNTFTQFSSEGGIPALVLFLCLLWAVVSHMRQVIRTTGGGPEMDQLRSLALATIVSLVSFVVGGLFAHLAYDYYVYYLAAIGVGIQNSMAGLAAALPTKDKRARNGFRAHLNRDGKEALP
jgi:O-antigen ligase